MRVFGEYAAIVLDIVMPPLGGGALGYWLDERYGTGPWIMVSFIGLGFAAAVINTVRLVQKLDRESKENGTNKKN